MPFRIVIAGIAGNMGRALADAVRSDPACLLMGGFGRGSAEANELLADADVVLDFTTPGASAALAEYCAARGGPAVVIGSTGFEQHVVERILVAARRVPIVRSGSFSLGINVLLGLVRQAAQALGSDGWDVEILEAHHRRKVDAPSGTALMLGEAVAAGRGVPLAAVARRTRDGMTGPRPAGEIGFSVLRGGSIVGDHSVIFAGDGERVDLSHVASDRSMFAAGAMAAARWIVGREPGHYDMLDVLGL